MIELVMSISPTRTDNAIKNHWNSSVKKKVDSYMASGLLAQVPCLPLVECPAHCNSSSVMNQQNNEDSGCNATGEVEDLSCRSQSSLAMISCSQVQNTNMVLSGDLQLNVDASNQNAHSSISQGVCYTSAEAVTSALSDVHYHVSSSNFDLEKALEKEFDEGMSLHMDIDEVPSNSMFVDNQTLCSTENQEMSLVPVDATQEIPVSKLSNVSGADQTPCLISEAEFNSPNCLESEVWQDISLQRLVSGPDAVCADSSSRLNHQPDVYSSKVGTNLVPNPSEVTETVLDQKLLMTISPCFILPDSQAEITCSNNSFGDAEQSAKPGTSDGRPGASTMMESIKCGDQHLIDAEEPVASTEEEQSSKNIDTTPGEKKDKRSLFYRPPLFPGLDDPFVSCDLVTSGDLQEYSPLGIRQLMRSTMNAPTPLRLWGSPTNDKSPDVLLKSAAKSFRCTPSIMKKRQRDLLSPTPDKRTEKKSGTEKECRMADTSGISTTTHSMNATKDEAIIAERVVCAEQSASFKHLESKIEFTDGNKENFSGAPEWDRYEQNARNKHHANEQARGQQCYAPNIANTNDDQPDNLQTAGILVEHNSNNLISLDHGANPEALPAFVVSRADQMSFLCHRLSDGLLVFSKGHVDDDSSVAEPLTADVFPRAYI